MAMQNSEKRLEHKVRGIGTDLSFKLHWSVSDTAISIEQNLSTFFQLRSPGEAEKKADFIIHDLAIIELPYFWKGLE
jgi:hypothetical protein